MQVHFFGELFGLKLALRVLIFAICTRKWYRVDTLYCSVVNIANVCEHKILRFWANPQKYQTLVPAKNSHLKVFVILLIAYDLYYKQGGSLHSPPCCTRLELKPPITSTIHACMSDKIDKVNKMCEGQTLHVLWTHELIVQSGVKEVDYVNSMRP